MQGALAAGVFDLFASLEPTMSSMCMLVFVSLGTNARASFRDSLSLSSGPDLSYTLQLKIYSRDYLCLCR